MQRIAPNVLSWASILEPQAEEQIRQTAQLPFIYKHLAIMPDVHFGKGSTIGTVIPTKDAIVPAAVGVDIGCGLAVTRLDLTREELGDLRQLRAEIERTIPKGKGQNNSETGAVETAVDALEKSLPPWLDPDSFSMNWRYQLGTLGAGNHFLEVDEDHEGKLWLTLHSGSRNIGLKLAEHYIRRAQVQGQDLPHEDLAYFEVGDLDFSLYLSAVQWAQYYAFLNRKEMMRRMLAAVSQQIADPYPLIIEQFDVHHNYVAEEKHDDDWVWVTRKGAIYAPEGELGIIPGTMGTPSYIVAGKGNRDAFHSAPHGAGRVMSRNQARKRLDLEAVKAQMAGIESNIHPGILDEAPGAYKPIEQIISDAAELVDIRYVLRPILNVKG